jgi:hypothetical protein
MDGERKSILFREVNDRIAELLERAWPSAPGDFLCECGADECARRVTLALPEYVTIRRRGGAVASLDCGRLRIRRWRERRGASGHLAASA